MPLSLKLTKSSGVTVRGTHRASGDNFDIIIGNCTPNSTQLVFDGDRSEFEFKRQFPVKEEILKAKEKPVLNSLKNIPSKKFVKLDLICHKIDVGNIARFNYKGTFEGSHVDQLTIVGREEFTEGEKYEVHGWVERVRDLFYVKRIQRVSSVK